MNEHIKEIMEQFRFDKLHDAMTLLDWKWAGTGIPSVDELRKTAERLLRTASNGEVGGYIATGGFKASKWSEETLVLEFIIQSWYSG